ncbi:MAG: hypothetical protein IPG45_33935 [Deltaproteobacteria bacterium]|nr:hypothetical protein [Deltaproteobacteria bacterium]
MKNAAATGALALVVAGCLEPGGFVWPEREGLGALVMAPHPFQEGQVRAVSPAGALPLTFADGDFRAYGYPLDLESLQLPSDRLFGAEGEACGRVGRVLPKPSWIFGPGDTSTPLVEVDEEPRRLVGPIFDAVRCRQAGGAIHEVDESTVCMPAEVLEMPPAPAAPMPAAWPTGCTDLTDCAIERPPCPSGRYYLSRRGDCEALGPCEDNAWPAEVTHWVAEGAVEGDGSLAAPFGLITEAEGAGAVVIGLLPGEHVAPQRLGGLTLIGACAERTTLRLEAGTLVRRPARWERLTTRVGPGISTAINVDGPALELDAVALVGTSSRAIFIQNGGRLQARRSAIVGFVEQVTVETSTAVLKQVALQEFSATAIAGRDGAFLTVDNVSVVASVDQGATNFSIYSRDSSLTVRDLRVEGFAASGLVVDGGRLRASDVEVSGPARSRARSGGIMLRCPGSDRHRLERGLVRGSSHLGFEIAEYLGGQPCPMSGATELSDVRSAETVATRDNQYDAAGLRISGVAEVRVHRFESIADSRGLTFGDFVTDGVVTDVVVRDPVPPDRTERGVVRAVCPGCEILLQRVRISGAPTGLSIGPGSVIARDVEVEGGAIGFIVGEDLGAITNVIISQSRSVGSVTGFLFRRGASKLDQISTIDAQVGLQLAGALSSNSDVSRFWLEATEPLFSMVPGYVVRLDRGRMIGPGADLVGACANGQGWRLQSVQTSL